MIEDWIIKLTIGEYGVAVLAVALYFLLMLFDMVLHLALGCLSIARGGPFVLLTDLSSLPNWAAKSLSVSNRFAGFAQYVGFTGLWFVCLGIGLKNGGHFWWLLIGLSLYMCWDRYSSKRLKAAFEAHRQKQAAANLPDIDQ